MGLVQNLKKKLNSIGNRSFSRTIIKIIKQSVAKQTLKKQRQLFVHGVLTESLDDGTPRYYNSNILSRYFRKDYYGKND